VTPGKGKGPAVLSASFKAVRKQVCEEVQLLSRDELLEFVRQLSARGSSKRGAAASHLLTPTAMATRSTTVFWSFAHTFEGDVAGGVAILQAEL
jgi:hypothetical protein